MSSASTSRDQVLDHFELVRHLGAAEHRDERPLRMLETWPRYSHLRRHQQPGGRFLDVMHDAFGRRVRAVRRAERVVDVDVRQLGELLREAASFFSSSGWKRRFSSSTTCCPCRRGRSPPSPARRCSRQRTRPAVRAAPTAAPRPASASTPDSACPSAARDATRGSTRGAVLERVA